MKKFFLILLVMSILISSVQTIFAAGVTEHSFGYDHPDITWGGWHVTLLDSTGSANWLYYTWDNNGYYNAWWYKNNTASTVLNCIASDGIFYINAHGNRGMVTCAYYDTSASVWKLQNLTATNTKNSSTAKDLQSKFGTDVYSLSKVRIAYFSSCYSGATDYNYGFGNLIQKCWALGARCAVGFAGTVSPYESQMFDEAALGSYGMSRYYNISESLASAQEDVWNYYGDYGGVDTYTWYGRVDSYLVPAAYGNQ